MRRKYSAEEISDAILKLKAFQEDKMTLLRIEDMLNQAADDLERERRYEYAVKVTDILDKDICGIYKSADLQDAKDMAETMKDHESIVAVVRRSVGEWEEVDE